MAPTGVGWGNCAKAQVDGGKKKSKLETPVKRHRTRRCCKTQQKRGKIQATTRSSPEWGNGNTEPNHTVMNDLREYSEQHIDFCSQQFCSNQASHRFAFLRAPWWAWRRPAAHSALPPAPRSPLSAALRPLFHPPRFEPPQCGAGPCQLLPRACLLLSPTLLRLVPPQSFFVVVLLSSSQPHNSPGRYAIHDASHRDHREKIMRMATSGSWHAPLTLRGNLTAFPR